VHDLICFPAELGGNLAYAHICKRADPVYFVSNQLTSLTKRLLLISTGPGVKIHTDEDEQSIEDLAGQDLDSGGLLYEPEVLQLIPHVYQTLKLFRDAAVRSTSAISFRRVIASSIPILPEFPVVSAVWVAFPGLLKTNDQCSRISRCRTSGRTGRSPHQRSKE
jgi:hypothetical protein